MFLPPVSLRKHSLFRKEAVFLFFFYSQFACHTGTAWQRLKAASTWWVTCFCWNQQRPQLAWKHMCLTPGCLAHRKQKKKELRETEAEGEAANSKLGWKQCITKSCFTPTNSTATTTQLKPRERRSHLRRRLDVIPRNDILLPGAMAELAESRHFRSVEVHSRLFWLCIQKHALVHCEVCRFDAPASY